MSMSSFPIMAHCLFLLSCHELLFSRIFPFRYHIFINSGSLFLFLFLSFFCLHITNLSFSILFRVIFFKIGYKTICELFRYFQLRIPLSVKIAFNCLFLNQLILPHSRFNLHLFLVGRSY